MRGKYFLYWFYNKKLYFSGIQAPRGMSDDGRSELPSSRQLSSALISHEDRPDNEFTLLLMQWGQFVDHDVTHTPLNKGKFKYL